MPKRRPHLAAQRAQALDDLSRAIFIDMCKDKTLTYRPKGQPSFNGLALPVFSVDTVEEAQHMQLLSCAVQYNEHPLMPGRNWYRLSSYDFNTQLEVDDLPRVTAHLRELYLKMKRRETQRIDAQAGTDRR